MPKTKPTLYEEKRLWNKKFKYVIGVDEVGRGSFAGPVVAAAVVFKKDIEKNKVITQQVNDSKLLSLEKRTRLDKKIRLASLLFSIASVEVKIINKYGIGKATAKAMRKAISNLISGKSSRDFFVIIDGFHIKYIRSLGLKYQKAIIKGDRKSISIAAASIIAKVYRDKLMIKLDKQYPKYSFAKNKGYGTKQHQNAIKQFGLCEIHRRSFDLKKYETIN